MKVNKIIYSLLLAFGFVGISSTISMVAAQASNTFEIMNKSKSDIWIEFSSKAEQSDIIKVPPTQHGTFSLKSATYIELPMNGSAKDKTLRIWTEHPAQGKTSGVWERAKKAATGVKDPNYIYRFNADNVDILVTFNPEDKKTNLYPQTGPLMGWTGKTESGKPLDKNISQGSIQRIK